MQAETVHHHADGFAQTSGVACQEVNGAGGYVELATFARSPEFSTLSTEAKAALTRVANARVYSANSFIYLQEDEANQLYFVRSGYVRLSYLMEDGSPILFGILPAGESFGELGVFDNSSHCDMATAVGAASIVSVPANAFRGLAERFPELDAALGRAVARRYRSYVALTRGLGLKTLPARLSQALLRLADGLRTSALHNGQSVQVVGPYVTQADLGLIARGARGNVNRALKAWERLGWIAIEDRSVLILNRTQLEALSIEEGL